MGYPRKTWQIKQLTFYWKDSRAGHSGTDVQFQLSDRQRQEDLKFKASQGNLVRPWLKIWVTRMELGDRVLPGCKRPWIQPPLKQTNRGRTKMGEGYRDLFCPSQSQTGILRRGLLVDICRFVFSYSVCVTIGMKSYLIWFGRGDLRVTRGYVCGSQADTRPFYTRALSTCNPGTFQESGTTPSPYGYRRALSLLRSNQGAGGGQGVKERPPGWVGRPLHMIPCHGQPSFLEVCFASS